MGQKLIIVSEVGHIANVRQDACSVMLFFDCSDKPWQHTRIMVFKGMANKGILDEYSILWLLFGAEREACAERE